MKNSVKWTGLLIAGTTLFLSACGQEEEKTTAYDKIVKEGTLTVATAGTLYPTSFHDEESNKLTGFDVEVVKEVAKRLDLKVNFKEMSFDGMLTSVNTGQVDLAANDITITEERKAKFAFSKPYKYTYGTAIVRKSDLSDIQSLEDLKGKKAAGEATTTYMQIAKKYGAKEVTYDNATNDQYLRDVSNGRTDVILNDYYLQSLAVDFFKDFDITIHPDIAYNPSQVGLIMDLDNKELQSNINAQIEAMKKDGTLAKLSKQYYANKDVSKMPDVKTTIVDVN
ncbi:MULTISPECIES: transporter substrate-binding domain-containing protein [unclassified Exiguobacterium]|uniref:transporter substrate-binding domain-containing protein n=1 Tax=unclassified Exiguobacterium TaxID=2644629 RepID=UPI000B587367|nr:MULTISPECIES: transporter substrate-binding domain-containing protein [unclassified Exiguobacterium]ASI35588.1 amino acid ABC transporter substrate-binding protein [Exiguobacterium sp. N4-1P]